MKIYVNDYEMCKIRNKERHLSQIYSEFWKCQYWKVSLLKDISWFC